MLCVGRIEAILRASFSFHLARRNWLCGFEGVLGSLQGYESLARVEGAGPTRGSSHASIRVLPCERIISSHGCRGEEALCAASCDSACCRHDFCPSVREVG
jgi:hypothetical protein